MAEISSERRLPAAPLHRAWLRDWREGEGLSRARLAEIVGTSADSVRRWESGQTAPQMRYRAHLAELIGVDVSELHRLLATPSSNVVSLPLTPARRQSQQDLEVGSEPSAAERASDRFNLAVLRGIEDGYAQSPEWNDAVNRLARRLRITW